MTESRSTPMTSPISDARSMVLISRFDAYVLPRSISIVLFPVSLKIKYWNWPARKEDVLANSSVHSF